MEEPFDQETARGYVLAILEGPGMTVFTRRVKAELLENGMTSSDAVNVLRGGRIAPGTRTASGWTYRAETLRMNVLFSFRGQGRKAGAGPNELVIESAWRSNR